MKTLLDKQKPTGFTTNKPILSRMLKILQERKITLPGNSYVWEGMKNTEVVSV